MRGKRVGSWKAVTLAASGLVMLAVTVPAEASVCSRLQQQYLSAGGSSGGGGDAKARRQLGAALAEAKQKNCRRLGIFAKPAKDCPKIMRRISNLQSQVGRVSFSRGPSRDNIRSQLRRNGCAIPGGDGGGSGLRIASSGYRTLCVRTCDGYYFPVNFRSSTSRFKVDEAVCKSMYGGAGAELFYHANGASAEEAIAVNGRRRLASEPYAFAYRTTFKPSCQSELKSGLANLEKIYEKRIASEGVKKKGSSRGVVQPTALPIPVARVSRGEDPETLANRAGGFAVAPVEPMDLEDVIVATTEIRRLGPDYYYIAPQTIEALYEPPDLGPEFSLISAAQAADGPHDDADQPGSTVVQ